MNWQGQRGTRLQGRITRASLAALILSMLFLPVASLAGPRDELRQTRRQLHRLRDRLESRQSRAASLKDRIDGLNKAMTELQIQINDLDADIADVRAKVRIARAQIRTTQEKADAIRELATEQAILLYEQGATSTLDALLSSKSLRELNDRVELLGVAAQNNTSALVEYGRLRALLEFQHERLFEREAELAEKLRQQSDVKKELDERRKELAAEFARLSSNVRRDKQHIQRLESAAKKIKRTILSRQAVRAVESLGTSAEGFIWPLNGPIVSPFGPRWGSMHNGVDIDGYTGQPIIAAKAGRVIYLGSGMSGYGNVIIIDHGGGISTLYAHLSGYATSGGANVDQGEVIGYVGCTGHCYGDHLHFEVRVGGNPVDPMRYLP